MTEIGSRPYNGCSHAAPIAQEINVAQFSLIHGYIPAVHGLSCKQRLNVCRYEQFKISTATHIRSVA